MINVAQSEAATLLAIANMATAATHANAIAGLLRAAPAAATDTDKKAHELGNAVRSITNFLVHANDGIFLVLVANFEAAVRSQIASLTTEYTAKHPIFSDLPVDFQETYFKLVVQAHPQHDIVGIGRQQMFESLGKCYQSTVTKQAYDLIPECLHFTRSNFKYKVIGELLNRFGIDVWSKWPGTASAKAQFPGQKSGQIRTHTQQTLDGFIDLRNSITHRGSRYRSPGTSEIGESGAFFGRLLVGIETILNDHLARL